MFKAVDDSSIGLVISSVCGAVHVAGTVQQRVLIARPATIVIFKSSILGHEQ